MKFKLCPFCTLIQNPSDDSYRLLSQSPDFIVILSQSPQTTGHLLVIPITHVTNLSELSVSQISILFSEAISWGEKLLSNLSAKAYILKVNNLLTSLETKSGHLDHIHLHVIPRYHANDNFIPKKASPKALELIRAKLNP